MGSAGDSLSTQSRDEQSPRAERTDHEVTLCRRTPHVSDAMPEILVTAATYTPSVIIKPLFLKAAVWLAGNLLLLQSASRPLKEVWLLACQTK